ncbi:MAG: hypothetical protein WAL75_09870, partial [Terracidiphilus sp.]
ALDTQILATGDPCDVLRKTHEKRVLTKPTLSYTALLLPSAATPELFPPSKRKSLHPKPPRFAD